MEAGVSPREKPRILDEVRYGLSRRPNVVDYRYAVVVERESRFQVMEVNNLGFVASILFVLVPTVFLLILYIQTSSKQTGS